MSAHLSMYQVMNLQHKLQNLTTITFDNIYVHWSNKIYFSAIRQQNIYICLTSLTRAKPKDKMEFPA